MFTKKDTLKAKGLAIMLLLFYHLFFVDRGCEIDLKVVSIETLHTLATMARICVWVFVFLSAYGLSVQIKKYDNKDRFVFHYWLNLISEYWIVYVFVFFLWIVSYSNPFEKYDYNIGFILLDFIGWSDFFKTPTLMSAWWYMCFAQLLVLCFPLLINFVKKSGAVPAFIISLVCTVLFNSSLVSTSGGCYFSYFPAAILGIIFAENDMFEKLQIKKNKTIIMFLILITIIFISYCRICIIEYSDGLYDWKNIHWTLYSFGAVLVCIYSLNIQLQPIVFFLEFLGKYSGNIFMVHMFYVSKCSKVIFASSNIFLIYITTLLLSLFTSLAIEELKKTINYAEWVKTVENKVVEKIGYEYN